MATSDLTFSGKNQALFVSADIETPSWKMVMCQISIQVQSSNGDNLTETKCGTINDGEKTASVTVEGMAIKKPGTPDPLLVDVVDFWENYYKPGTTWLWRIAPQDEESANNGEPIQLFSGKISNNSLTHPSDTKSTFSFEITVDDGDITTTSLTAA